MYFYIYLAWYAISDIYLFCFCGCFCRWFIKCLHNTYIIFKILIDWCVISGICVCCLSIRLSVNLDRNIMPLTLQILVEFFIKNA